MSCRDPRRAVSRRPSWWRTLGAGLALGWLAGCGAAHVDPPAEFDIVARGGAGTPKGVVLDDAHIVWQTSAGIWMAPRSGGDAVQLTSKSTSHLAISGETLIWVDDGIVEMSPRTRQARILGASPESYFYFMGIVADESEVFVSLRASFEHPPELFAFRRGHHQLRALEGDARGPMDQDADHLYMLLGDQLLVRPKHGGGWRLLAHGLAQPGALAVTGDTVVVASTPRQAPSKILAVSAASGAVEELATTTGVAELAAAGRDACWRDVGYASYVYCVVRGCAAVATMVSAQPNVGGLAVMDHQVYWLVNHDGELEVRRRVIEDPCRPRTARRAGELRRREPWFPGGRAFGQRLRYVIRLPFRIRCTNSARCGGIATALSRSQRA